MWIKIIKIYEAVSIEYSLKSYSVGYFYSKKYAEKMAWLRRITWKQVINGYALYFFGKIFLLSCFEPIKVYNDEEAVQLLKDTCIRIWGPISEKELQEIINKL